MLTRLSRKPGLAIKFHGQEGLPFHAEVALKAWPWLCHLFHGHEGQAFRAEMALKAWPWPGLPSFPRPHFPGKPGKKAGKSGQARLLTRLLGSHNSSPEH